MSFLELRGITKSYGSGDTKAQVLGGIDLSVEKGEFVVMLGPSGCGKSTLLNIIGGIDRADSGDIIIDGASMGAMNERALTAYRREHLGYIFQRYNLIPNLTVKENIEVGSYLSKAALDMDMILDILGLREHKDKLPGQLSGGQQQRCAIGRAIIKNPDILLCDEPTGALDSKTSIDILKLIDSVNRRYHNTIIMVTHNASIGEMADRVIKLRDGMIRKEEKNQTRKAAEDIEW